ncbi:MAG TPA: O-antigen ligase family protein, partial [Bryobacterales bacterium]|nr:O-antigen ligase family protein [Bryobacterales bacterium]
MAQQSAWAWPEAGAEAAAPTVAQWPLAAGALAVAGPCMWLAAHAAASPADQTPAYAAVFVILAGWAAAIGRRGIAVRLPLLCWFALVWPLVGLAPLPRMLLARIDPQRAAELAEFVRAGITSPPTISLYPYATARALLMVAASVALFTLARGLGSRSIAALQWMAGAVLVMALAEALPALRQHAMLATGAARPLQPGGDFIHGTFGNRNLLAAWLEGCYGVALAVFVAGTGQRRDGGPSVAGLNVFAGVAALASATAILCSFSRMGVVTLALETVLVGWLLWGGGWRARLAAAALVLGAAACLLVAGAPGFAGRYSAASLAAEKEGRLAMWADAVRAMRRYPLLGSGAGTFAFAFRRSHPYLTGYTIDHAHCEYLETAVEWGIPAVVLLAAL